MKKTTTKYEIIQHDLNADGSVNAAHHTNRFIKLALEEDNWIQKLQKAGELDRSADPNDFEIMGSNDYYIYYNGPDGTSCPLSLKVA